MIGQVLDHYRILELLGSGAMGVVYKALDVNLERPVAVKVMGAAARNEPNFVERFREEARMQGALSHPNIAVLFDYFLHDGAPVAVMEFIDGESMEQLLKRRGRLPAAECVPLFRQALAGVAAAHRAGIVHRDLKPSNLMITRDGVVKVMDFGIARRQGVSGAATKVGASTSIGSPLYMAPEQILGRTVDCRTDIYALGVTLYELLCGRQPFTSRGKTEYSLLNAHVNELPEPPTVHYRHIPGPVVDAVLRALAKEPEDRFQTAEEFLAALDEKSTPATVAAASAPSGTVTLEYCPADIAPVDGRNGDTLVLEPPQPPPEKAGQTLAFDYSGTLHREAPSGAAPATPSEAPPAAVPPAAPHAKGTTRSVPPQRQSRTLSLGRAALLAGALVIVLAVAQHHAHRLHAVPQSASVPAAAASAPAAAPGTEVAPEQGPPAPAPRPPLVAATPAPAPVAANMGPGLSGSWQGEYTDAAGRRVLRVVALNISRVGDDGGIEGSLVYETASGDGACKLHARGSTYLASQGRLQLSPEGCSPHYPRELGVPLDFSGVRPQASTLDGGRVETPTGEPIRVRLTRVTGV